MPFPAQESGANQDSREASFENLRRKAADEAEAGKTTDAERDIRQALDIHPDWKEGWWNLGTLEYETNQYKEASQAFQKVVEANPEIGTAWALMGLCEFEMKDYPHALTHLGKAQALGFGDDSEISRVSGYHLALLLIREGDFERGSELLNATFGQGTASSQVKMALGLGMLRVPLLPEELDSSKDAVVRAAGEIASSGTEAVALFPKFVLNNPTIPYIHYAFGLRLREAQRWSDALVQQQEEVKLSPQSSLPWIQISELQLKLRHPADAVSAAEMAVAIAPNNPACHERLAFALDARGKTETANKERKLLQSLSPEAKVRDPKMISLYGSSSDATDRRQENTAADGESWKQAMLAYSSARYADAIAELKSWLQQNPTNGTGWAVLGLSEFALGDHDNARIHLERGKQFGLSGSPESVRLAQYTLGILLVDAGDFGEAAEVLTSASGPGNLQAEVRFASGLALLHIRKLPDQVEPAQRQLIDHAGEIAQLLHTSKYDQADAEFEVLLKHYPTTPFIHYAYGTALLALSQYDEAAAQMRAEIAVSPASELPFVRLASIALRKESPDDAIAPAERAVQIAGKSAEAHYLLGKASLQTGNVPKAVQELEIACALAPGSPEAHFNLAKAYTKAGQTRKADGERATFIELNAAAEERKSRHGDQAYRGPHEADDMSVAPTAAGATKGPN
jgi:tetratricopeptide (TPR) repeat protein